jgi:hypothetical protein
VWCVHRFLSRNNDGRVRKRAVSGFSQAFLLGLI